MNYSKFDTYDFVKDEYFQQWVKAPDAETNNFWKTWIEQHPEKEDTIAEAREIILSINFKSKPASGQIEEQVWENVLKNRRPNSVKERQVFFSKKRLLSIAATLILISLAGGWLYKQNQLQTESTNTTLQKKAVIKESLAGTKTTFKLSDGSKIKLNAGSKLETDGHFGEEFREVYLEGEAYFEVEKDSSKPFIIHTGDVSTIVTGTSFNIGAYRNANDIKVAVTEGSVTVIAHRASKADTLLLKPADMAVYHKSTTHFEKVGFDPYKILGWKDGIIYFDNENCATMFPYLENWYGVQIEVEHPEKLLGSFVGEFENENLENVLTVMGNALSFDFQINHKTVLIKPKAK